MNSAKNAFSNMPKASGPIGALIAGLAGLGLAGYGISHSMYTVEGGQRAIVYSRLDGIQNEVFSEGLRFVVPWLQRPIIFDVKTRPKVINSTSGSKDLQMVQISLRVLYRPDSNNLASIYRQLGEDYDDRVLPSIVNEVSKAVVARYNASELLTKREQVSRMIAEQLIKRAEDFSIVLDDVSITHLAFSSEYTAAVEAKQVAQQDAERAKYVVDRALQERKTIVIRAEGEAQSAKLIGDALRDNPGFVELRRIAAAKEIASAVSNAQARVFLNSDALLLNTLGDTIIGGGGDSSRSAGISAGTHAQPGAVKKGLW